MEQPYVQQEAAAEVLKPRRASDRELSYTLSNNRAIWVTDLRDALDTALEDGLRLLKSDRASIWRYLPDGSGMACVAQRDRKQGRLRPEGVLAAERYPGYFRTLALDGLINASDALSDPRTEDLKESYLRPQGVRALLDAALRREGRVFGVVCFEQRETKREWTQEECGLAVDIGNLVSQIFLIDELRGQNELLQLLNNLTIGSGAAHSIEEFADSALELMARQYPKAFVGFYRYHNRENKLVLTATTGYDWTGNMAEEVSSSSETRDSFVRLVLQSGGVILLPDCAQARDFTPSARERARRIGLRTGVGLPLIYDGKMLGCIVMLSSVAEELDEKQRQTFNTISVTLSVGLANLLAMNTLRFRALHDSLTRLGNKDRLREDFDALGDSSAALMVLDIRDFKQVNDTFGRGHGDNILQTLADRLAGIAQQFGGAAYRLSGAEFAILCSAKDPREITRKITPEIHSALAVPVNYGGISLGFSACIGVSHYPDHGTGLHANLRCADIALSLAKSSRNSVLVYDDACNAARPRNLELLTELRKAIHGELAGELSMVYQPKVDLSSGALRGCEALLRWQHPVFGFVAPDRFIRVAETGDLMGPLTERVLMMAFDDRGRFMEAGIDVPIAINVSASNIVDEGFPAQVGALINRFGVSPAALCFEITETVLMHDPKRAGRSIAGLAEIGIGFEVDDFGTGHSSLAYLRNLPLESLKIDRTFVRELTSQRNDQIIVKSTVGLAHGLGLKVVAEGVEDAETLDLLRELGCDQAQGYHIARPMKPADFLAWYREQES